MEASESNEHRKACRLTAVSPIRDSEADVIFSVVVELNKICRAATLQFALSVGEVIIKRFYGGDINRWRARDPGKMASLRKLASHPDLPMSPASLYRSIAFYELVERLGIQSWKHVSTTHLRMVLPLSAAEQQRLLVAAEANAWSVRRLDEEIKLLRHEGVSRVRGGRKRESPLSTALREFERTSKSLEAIVKSPSLCDFEVAPENARAVVDLLQRAAALCGSLEMRLKEAMMLREAVSFRAERSCAPRVDGAAALLEE